MAGRSGIYVDSDGNRFSRKTGMLVRPRRSRGYHARKANWYSHLKKDAKALGRTISAKLFGTLSREHRHKAAQRTAVHGKKR
jgi:hypothetical protein